MTSITGSIKKYLSFVKFAHTIFAMPFALIGYTLAVSLDEYNFSLRLLSLVILCMVFARNAAMGFNRYADRRFDALNPRTSERDIPAGRIGPKAAVFFVAVNVILFITTTAFINRLALFLSPVALIIVLGYSLTKRFTSLCHFILGLGLSLAPIGAYISVTGSFSLVPVIYSFIVLSWTAGFDIIYALQDDEFDKSNRLHSIPSSKGKKRALLISGFVHFMTFLLVIFAGIAGGAGYIYWIGAAIFTGLLIYQHTIVKHDDLSRVTFAFQTTNGVGSVLFAVFVIFDLLIR